MIFEGIENWILILGLVIGAISIPAISYWFKYQDVRKKKDVGKFGLDYAVSLGLVIVIGGLVAYICVIFGLPIVCKEIVVCEPSLAFVIALAVGGICSYLIDTALFHPLADGRVAQKWNKEQEEIRKQLASEEAKALFLSAVESKCKAFGITDETMIQMIAGMVKSEDDPQLLQLIGMFRPKEAQPEVIS